MAAVANVACVATRVGACVALLSSNVCSSPAGRVGAFRAVGALPVVIGRHRVHDMRARPFVWTVGKGNNRAGFARGRVVTFASAAETAGESSAAAADIPIGALDIRVGKVLKAEKHPDADGLYVEQVDLGEAEGPRTIVSGLVGFVPLEEMQGRLVAVLCNLKPRNMRGVKSNGMLLAASNAAHDVVELVTPPAGAAVGERVTFVSGEGQTMEEAWKDNKVQKKKAWETLQPLLNTSDDCVARFQEIPFQTSAGPCTVKSLKGARIA
eukprot:jgi/Mesvir1/3666/Mv14957-RA.1